MEVVEGETLGERMVRGQRLPAAGARSLPITEALAIARQIAEALEAAHDKGIVHRDLKPANIKVTPGGAVKVLDFGLAKAGGAAAGEGAASQATTADHTQAGRILGTASYMSPEQARGLTVDTRTDVWAFGCVLFEMLTGRQVFAGATFSDTVAAVIEREPDWTLLPPATPLLVRKLLRRCLAKDPKDRPRHMGDIGIELKDALQELATGAAEGAHSASTVVRQAPRRWGWAGATLAAVTVVAAYAGWQAWSSPGTSPPLRAVPLTSLPGVTRSPSFSPDGNQVAFTWTGPDGSNPDIYVQQVGAGAPLRLTTDPGNDHNPMWSPDGRWIAFLRGEGDGRPHELRLVPPLTGSERKLAEVRPHGFLRAASLAWCPDSSCVVATDSLGEGKPDALFAISLDSGEKRQLTHPPVFADSDPAISPDGKWLVFRREVAPFAGGLELVSLRPDLTEDGEPRRLTPTNMYAYNPRWTPDSAEIVFSAKEALWRLRITGEGTPERLPFVVKTVRRRSSRIQDLVVRRALPTSAATRMRTSGASRRPLPARRPRLRRPSPSRRRDGTPSLIFLLTGDRWRSRHPDQERTKSGERMSREAARSNSRRCAPFQDGRDGRPTASRLLFTQTGSTGTATSSSFPQKAASLETSRHIPPQTCFPATRATAAGSTSARRAPGVPRSGTGESRLQFFDLASGKAVTVAGNLGPVEAGVSASTDGRTIVFTRVDSSVNDLMLVEGFR